MSFFLRQTAFFLRGLASPEIREHRKPLSGRPSLDAATMESRHDDRLHIEGIDALFRSREKPISQLFTLWPEPIYEAGRPTDAHCAGKNTNVAADGPRKSLHVDQRIVRDATSTTGARRQASSGMLRRRAPVAAKSAAASAGAIVGVGGSPTPPGSASLCMMCASITGGACVIRRIR